LFLQATFEAFIAIRDDEATYQLKLFSDNLQVRETLWGQGVDFDFSF